MNIIERVKAPTPTFFKKLRNISLVCTALAASLLSAPVALPLLVLKIAGYVAVAGAVGSTVSQAVTSEEAKPAKTKKNGTANSER
jgi:hypothetical protein